MKLRLEIEPDPRYWNDDDESTFDAIQIARKAINDAPLGVPRGEYRRIPVRDDNGSRVGTLTIDNQE